MFERLNQIETKYDELTRALASPEIDERLGRNTRRPPRRTARSLTVVEKYREFKDLKRGIDESKAMLADENDAEMRAYAQEELDAPGRARRRRGRRA